MWIGFSRMRRADAGSKLFGLTLPPLILAWRTIQNRHRAVLFVFYLIVMPVLVGLFFGVVLENMIIKQHILANTLWGMPYLVLLVEGLAYLGYQLNRQHLWVTRSDLEQAPA